MRDTVEELRSRVSPPARSWKDRGVDEDDEERPKSRYTCSVCGVPSPPTPESFTQISSQFGWRLWRERLPTGQIEVRWYCPDCWKARKGP